MPELDNPKAAAAARENRPRLDLLEPAAEEMIAAALANGAITKNYGIRDYVTIPISYRQYIAAMERHIAALKRGEDLAQDSQIHHLGHLGANVHVLAAAIEAGNIVDDRGPFGPAVDTCEKLGVCPNCRQRAVKHGICQSCGYVNGDDTTSTEGYKTGAPVETWADRVHRPYLDIEDDH